MNPGSSGGGSQRRTQWRTSLLRGRHRLLVSALLGSIAFLGGTIYVAYIGQLGGNSADFSTCSQFHSVCTVSNINAFTPYLPLVTVIVGAIIILAAVFEYLKYRRS